MKTHGKQGKRYTAESFALTYGKKGDIFYSTKQDKNLTAIATHNNKSITTETLVVIQMRKRKPIASKITKVTILN